MITLSSDSGFGVGPEGQGPSEGQGQAALLRAGVDQLGRAGEGLDRDGARHPQLQLPQLRRGREGRGGAVDR